MLCNRAEVLLYLGRAESISAADLALLDMLHPLAESALKSYLQNDLAQAQHVEYYPLGQADPRGDEFPLEDFRVNGGGTVAIYARQVEGSEILAVKHSPLLLTGLEICEQTGGFAGQASGAFGSGTVLTLGTDYFVDIDDSDNAISRTGFIYRIGRWPTEPRSIKVTYYGGYTTAQLASDLAGAIKLAAIMTVAAAFNGAKQRQSVTGPKVSETLGKYSYTTNPQLVLAAGSFGTDIPGDAKMLLQPFRNYGRYLA